MRVAARQALLGLDAQIQFQLTIDAPYPLVIPGISLTTQPRDHLAETPAGLARGQALQQTANLFIIGLLASIAIGRTADAEQLADPWLNIRPGTLPIREYGRFLTLPLFIVLSSR